MSMLASSRTDSQSGHQTASAPGSETNSLTTRFQPYIEELRDFFASRHLPLNTPDSLPLFLNHLRDPAFHEETVSMVRSILYREETLPRIDLTQILAIAIAGPHILDEAPELHQSLRAILAFVQEVARARRGFPPTELLTPQPDPLPAALPASEPTQNSNAHHPPAASTADVAEIVPPREQESLQAPRLPEPLLSQTAPEKSNDPTSSSPEEQPAPATKLPAATPPIYVSPLLARPSLATLLRRSYWIPGVLVLALALAAVFFLKRPGSLPPAASTAPAINAAAPTRPKPSAYGRPLHAPSSQVFTSAPDTIADTTSPSQSPAPLPPERWTANPRELFRPSRSASKSTPASHLAAINPLAPREGVFLASSGAMASHLLSAPAPGYPKLASLTHIEGQVIVQVVVGRDGKVSATRVLDGPHLLRSAAEHAIHKWRYRPYLVDGHPTDVATIVTVSFHLR